MKVSIIIPTRERPQYLPYALQTALEIDDPDVEIIVNDNASADETANVVAKFDDPRLKYFNTGARVSMRENFNQALLNSSGDYVIYFGDDDGILPGQFACLKHLLETQRPDGVTWNRATYGWPNENFGRKTGGIRFYRDTSYGAPAAYDPNDNLDALLACRISQMRPMPNIYHGCASRAYLDRIAPEEGLYFDSAIPDVNFEYRATVHGGRFLFANHVFTISGYSPASTGGAHHGKSGDERSARAAQKFIAEIKADPFEDVIEHALSAPLAFMSTFETLRTRMGAPDTLLPDYVEWYRYVLSAGRKDPDMAQKLNDILGAYAQRTQTDAALHAAQVAHPKPKRTLRERLARFRSQSASFRRSAEVGGENTVLSAARMCDTVFGTDYDAVLKGSKSAGAAWRGARNRSKSFKKEL